MMLQLLKTYDGITGEDVTAKFDIKVENGMITANLKDGFTKSLGDDANTQIIDTNLNLPLVVTTSLILLVKPNSMLRVV